MDKNEDIMKCFKNIYVYSIIYIIQFLLEGVS